MRVKSSKGFLFQPKHNFYHAGFIITFCVLELNYFFVSDCSTTTSNVPCGYLSHFQTIFEFFETELLFCIKILFYIFIIYCHLIASGIAPFNS